MTDDLADFVQRGQAAQAAVTFEIASAELRKRGITLACLPPRHALKGVS